MTSVYTILLLLLFGVILRILIMNLLPFTGLIGVMIAGEEKGTRVKSRLLTGLIIAIIGQSYFYLSFIAFIISWTSSNTATESLSKYIVWLFAFLVSQLPIWIGAAMYKEKHNRKKSGYASITVEASSMTCVLSLFAFFLFIFFPRIMSLLWGWVPYVN